MSHSDKPVFSGAFSAGHVVAIKLQRQKIFRPGIVRGVDKGDVRRAGEEDGKHSFYEVAVDFPVGYTASRTLRVHQSRLFKMEAMAFKADDRVRVQKRGLYYEDPRNGTVLSYPHAKEQADGRLAWVYHVRFDSLGANGKSEVFPVEEHFMTCLGADGSVAPKAQTASLEGGTGQHKGYATIMLDPDEVGTQFPYSVPRDCVGPRLLYRWKLHASDGELGLCGTWSVVKATGRSLPQGRDASGGFAGSCLGELQSVEQAWVQDGACRPVLLMQRAKKAGDKDDGEEGGTAIWKCVPEELRNVSSTGLACREAELCWGLKPSADQHAQSHPRPDHRDPASMCRHLRDCAADLAMAELRREHAQCAHEQSGQPRLDSDFVRLALGEDKAPLSERAAVRATLSGFEPAAMPAGGCSALERMARDTSWMKPIRDACYKAPGAVVVVFGGMASGKSSFCRAWVDSLDGECRSLAEASRKQPQWLPDVALVEQPHFLSLDDAQERLHGAGLLSVPTMLRPYEQLSGGEQERADIARRLSDGAVLEDIGVRVNPDVAKAIAWSVQRRCRARGWSALISTSSVDVVRFLCPDLIVWLRDDGEIDVVRGPGSSSGIITFAGAMPSMEPDDDVPTCSPFAAHFAEQAAVASNKRARTQPTGGRSYATFALGPEDPPALGPHSQALAESVSLKSGRHATRLPACMGVPQLDFTLGIIVGASGTGKTQLARRNFGSFETLSLSALDGSQTVLQACEAARAAAVSAGAATEPPRADAILAALELSRLSDRLLSELSAGELSCVHVAASLRSHVFIDEFTSAHDRVTAQQFCRLFVRALDRLDLREVVVASVHADVAPWLAQYAAKPGLREGSVWVYSTEVYHALDISELSRPESPDAADVRALLTSVPRLQLTLRLCHKDWYCSQFAEYHYLDANIASSCISMVARLRELGACEKPDFGKPGKAVAFVSSMQSTTGSMSRREHRLVVHPNYQVSTRGCTPLAGTERSPPPWRLMLCTPCARPWHAAVPFVRQGMSIGAKVSNLAAECFNLAVNGSEYSSVTVHATFGRSRDNNALWKARARSGQHNPGSTYPNRKPCKHSGSRITFSHVYVGVRAVMKRVSGTDCFATRADDGGEATPEFPGAAKRPRLPPGAAPTAPASKHKRIR